MTSTTYKMNDTTSGQMLIATETVTTQLCSSPLDCSGLLY